MRLTAVGLLLLIACEGPKGPEGSAGPSGPTGDVGPTGSSGPSGSLGPVGPTGSPGSDGGAGMNGQPGDAGTAGCPGLNAGETPGVFVGLSLSSPQNGQYFTSGERAVATIQLSNKCLSLRPADVATANLYAYGPRGAFAKTASGLLNCITDRTAADRQHHVINLRAPKFLDTSVSNFAQAADGTISFTFSPITNEAAGTYTVGVWVEGNDPHDQVFALADLQIGTATVETYATGAGDNSSCFGCHRAAGDQFAQMHHSRPGFSPFGDYSLDQWPVATCKACHNVDGYSTNPALRKTHGVHRGANQHAPGVAHPEYGLGADTSLAQYTNVVFPSMPGVDKNCSKCHADDRWKTLPSRLACGTCHDNLFFDTGTFTPARIFGKPATGNCGTNTDCASFGRYAVCDTNMASATFGSCIHDLHPAQADDSQCVICHNESPTALASVSAAHAIYQDTAVPGITLSNVQIFPSPSPASVIQVGDLPVVSFHFADSNGPIADLVTNSAYSLTALIAGPTDDRQALYAGTSKTVGVLSALGGGDYTYAFPSPFPATSQPPQNTTGPTRINPPGTYTLWLYLNKSLTVNGQGIRDVANSVVDFKFSDGTLPLRPRRIVTEAACNTCHTNVQAHGGGRKDKVEMCTNCHNVGASDRGSARPDQATGAQCKQSAPICGAFQTCQPAPVGMAPPKAPNDGYCIVNPDPTPGQTIDFGPMIHDIHFARLLAGYNQSNFLAPYTGKLTYMGFNNTITDASQILLPMDVRNCTSCHADAKNTCASDNDCGTGQSCVNKSCMNSAWTAPSARICLSCHDTDYAAGHAALNTWASPNGNVETCLTCHDTDGDFSVKSVHSIRNPYVPTYQRSPE